MLIADILRRKGDVVVTIQPGATVSDAIASLATHGVGALVVSGDARHAEGMVSERDIVRRLDRTREALLSLPVEAIMSAPVLTCVPDDEVDAVMRTMTESRVRHLPVTDDGALAGLVSIGDVVKATIEKLEQDRRLLEDYISAR